MKLTKILLIQLNAIVLLCFKLQFSKGQKSNTYNIRLDRLEAGKGDSSLVDYNANAYFFNRSTKSINFTMKLIKQIPDNTMVFVQCFKFLSNIYRLSAIQFSDSLEGFLKTHLYDFQTLFLKKSKQPLTYPPRVDVFYRLKDWTCNSAYFPQNIPFGKYKVDIVVAVNKSSPLLALAACTRKHIFCN